VVAPEAAAKRPGPIQSFRPESSEAVFFAQRATFEKGHFRPRPAEAGRVSSVVIIDGFSDLWRVSSRFVK